MTDTKKRKDMSLGLADAADRIAKVLATAPERRHKALEKADADEVAAIQTALDKLVARVPADLRGKLVSVLAAMEIEVGAPFVVQEPLSAASAAALAAGIESAKTEPTVDAAIVMGDPEPSESATNLPRGAAPYQPGPAARAARSR